MPKDTTTVSVQTLTDEALTPAREHKQIKEQPLLSIAQDISDHKHNLEELERIKGFFTQAVNSSQHILYRLDVKKGRYDYLSPLFEEITGYPVAEFVNTTYAELAAYMHPDDRLRIFALIDAAGRSRTTPTASFDLEYRFRKADGSYCWLHDVTTACFDDQGGLECFFGSARDISERKELEREAERLNQLYDALSCVNESIVRVSSRGELLAEVAQALVEFGKFKMAWFGVTNRATMQIEIAAHKGDASGYLRGLQVFADDRPGGLCPTGTAVREARTYICNDFFNDPRTLPWREAASRAGWRSSAAFPLREDGNVCGALTVYDTEDNFFGEREIALLEDVARDVSFALDALKHKVQREEAEKSLRKSEGKYRQIFENPTIGIFQATVSGRFLSVNPLMARLFAYDSPEEMLTLITDIAGQLFLEPGLRSSIIASVLTRDDYTVEEVEYRRKDGSKFFANLYIRAVRGDSGEVLFVEGFIEEISERKRAETLLRELNAELEKRVKERTAELETANRMLTLEVELRKQAQDEVVILNKHLLQKKVALEVANKDLESFSYSVSLALRAPLWRMDGFCKILDAECAQKHDKAGRDYIQRIHNAAVKMDKIVNALLDLSHTMSKEVINQPVNLSAIAREIMSELVKTRPQQNVTLNIEDGLTVEADLRLMKVVIFNLLDNAWKYTAQKNETIIEFGTIGTDAGRAFYVRDNGAGLDMAYAEKLFAPFEKLHGQEFEGIGIGLATVQRIINRHGGRVWAEGAPRKGVTFYFRLA